MKRFLMPGFETHHFPLFHLELTEYAKASVLG